MGNMTKDGSENDCATIEILKEIDGSLEHLPPSEGWSAATRKTIALCGLVSVQILVGVATKLAVTGDTSVSFSPASLLIVTESFKFCMSWTTQASREWKGSLVSAFVESFSQLYHSITSLVIPYGFLAFAYALNNNISWFVYRSADLTSIATVRAAAILVSAIVSVLMLKRRITSVQWAGMIGQTAGVFITQVDECEGHSREATSTYLLMMVTLVVSCVCAVWNEKLIKGLHAPLAVQQMSLYGFGLLFNIATYFANPSRMHGGGFFDGWHGWTVISAIANALVGLAVMVALKYGDSIVKAMAGPITAFCITVIDIGLLGTTMSTTAMVATLPIFMGSYIYIVESGRMTVGTAKRDQQF